MLTVFFSVPNTWKHLLGILRLISGVKWAETVLISTQTDCPTLTLTDLSTLSTHLKVCVQCLGRSDKLRCLCRWTPRTGTGLCPPAGLVHPKSRYRSLCVQCTALPSAPPGGETGCCCYETTASPWRVFVGGKDSRARVSRSEVDNKEPPQKSEDSVIYR